MFKKKEHYYLLFIVLVAVVLRIVNVTHSDVVTDEALYSFRSVGYLDYMASQLQTTPVDWFGLENLPWWSRLSFHDHPPLVFLIQFLFFSVFGVSVLVARLPFVIAGVVSVYLVYLIGRELSVRYARRDEHGHEVPRETHPSRVAGLVAAGLLAVDPYHVWISRIGYMESVVIAFMLLSVLLFLKSSRRNCSFYWWGLVTGLMLLTKYTAFFLIPVFVLYLLFFHRPVFRVKQFWVGVVIVFVVFSPVVIYNLFLYRTVGHFDLQFSSLFGQYATEWQGISRGAGFDLVGTLRTFWMATGPLYAIVVFVSFGYTLYRAIRFREPLAIFLILSVLLLVVLLSITGSVFRFMALSAPFAALLVTVGVLYGIPDIIRHQRVQQFGVQFFLLLLLMFLVFVSVNSHVLSRAWSQYYMIYRPLVTGDYGYRNLRVFIEEVIEDEGLAGTLYDSSDYRTMIIYDSDINYFPRMWYIERYVTYDAVPFSSTDETLARAPDLSYYRDLGFDRFYLIVTRDSALRVPEKHQGDSAELIEAVLIQEGIQPSVFITNGRGEMAFSVYQF